MLVKDLLMHPQHDAIAQPAGKHANEQAGRCAVTVFRTVSHSVHKEHLLCRMVSHIVTNPLL